MLVWAPAVETMYPQGFATQIVPQGPAKAGLEDTFRPHFFNGVATVVAKLLIQCTPDIALFGEKDFQQLKVVTRLARDLDLPMKIVGRADRARTRRPRDVIAQCLPVDRRARHRTDPLSRAEGVRGADRGRRADRPRARRRRPRDRASWLRARLSRTPPRRIPGQGGSQRMQARCASWSRPSSAAPG